MATTGVVQEVALEGRAPVVEDTHECSTRNVFGHIVLEDVRESHTVQRSTNHEPRVADDHGTSDRTGTLMYTVDGRMSVQIQFPASQASISNDYVLRGYEASFGTYEVNEQAQTITRHVEGSITSGLVGQSLTRAYHFADGRLTMRSVRPDERWSVTWERY